MTELPEVCPKCKAIQINGMPGRYMCNSVFVEELDHEAISAAIFDNDYSRPPKKPPQLQQSDRCKLTALESENAKLKADGVRMREALLAAQARMRDAARWDSTDIALADQIAAALQPSPGSVKQSKP